MIKDIIIHDRTAPGPNTPDHPPALVPLPQNTRQVTALPSIVRCGGPAVVFAAEEFFSGHSRHGTSPYF